MTRAEIFVTRKRFVAANVAVAMILAIFLLAVGILYYWLFFDTANPVTITYAEPIKPAFVQGEPIVIEERIIVHRRCPGTVSRAVIDGANTAYPLLMPSDPLLPLASERMRISFMMPEILRPGRYRYRSEAVWQCNPLRTIRQPIVDVSFLVVPAPPEEVIDAE